MVKGKEKLRVSNVIPENGCSFTHKVREGQK